MLGQTIHEITLTVTKYQQQVEDREDSIRCFV